MIAVATIPMARPTNGFSAKENSSSARSPAMPLKPSPIMPTPLSRIQMPMITAIQLAISLALPSRGRKPSGSLRSLSSSTSRSSRFLFSSSSVRPVLSAVTTEDPPVSSRFMVSQSVS